MRIHRNFTEDSFRPASSLYGKFRGRRLQRVAMSVHFSARSVLLLALLTILISPGAPRADENHPMQSLDEQVQDVKSDVLSIGAELNNLEEKLLYPSDTQVSVFISLSDAGSLQLDSAEIRIDGELVATHVYSFKELEALKRGGIQRIHTGNIATGEHQLGIQFKGTLGDGNVIDRIRSFSFTKDVGPKLLEVSFSGQNTGDGLISLGRQ